MRTRTKYTDTPGRGRLKDEVTRISDKGERER